MRTLLIIILMLSGMGCVQKQSNINQYTRQDSTIVLLKATVQTLNSSIILLKDSILKLNQRAVISTDQYIQLYRYDRLYKYYRICVNNPVQWKYYKGWSTRVFTE